MDGYVTHTDPTTGETTTTKAKRCGLLNQRHQVTLAIYVMTLIPALLVDDLGAFADRNNVPLQFISRPGLCLNLNRFMRKHSNTLHSI